VGRFGIAMGRFGHTENLWAILVHGPFWSFPNSTDIGLLKVIFAYKKTSGKIQDGSTVEVALSKCLLSRHYY